MRSETPNMENRPLVDQLDAARFERVRAEVLARPSLFAKGGSVVAGWRRRGPARFGPYYRLAYRDQNRQRSIYLGRSAGLVAKVGQLLRQAQKAVARPVDEAGQVLRSVGELGLGRAWIVGLDHALDLPRPDRPLLRILVHHFDRELVAVDAIPQDGSESGFFVSLQEIGRAHV
jgi:hypothetical protein